MRRIFDKLIGDKKEWRRQQARVAVLPQDYRYVYKKIQEYMFGFGAGNGMDIIHLQYELIDLFEAGAAQGKGVLEITGPDVAAFADDLLSNARTYMEDRRAKLNREVTEQLTQWGETK